MKKLEVEIKSRCENFNLIQKKIKELGATLDTIEIEQDIYYNHPSRDFKETDEAFRIRSTDDKNILTYKGPKLGGLSKTRHESETKFDSFDEMQNIRTSLGFKETGSVKKERTIYKLEDISFCLDRVDGVGDFIEIEKIGFEREKIESELFALAKKLDLTEFITQSYLEMVLALRQAQ